MLRVLAEEGIPYTAGTTGYMEVYDPNAPEEEEEELYDPEEEDEVENKTDKDDDGGNSGRTL
jgi:hypothetical protein